MVMLGLAPLKTLIPVLTNFRGNQGNECIKPFFISLGTSLIARYHQLENLLVETGLMGLNPNLWRMINQTCLAKAQEINKCWIDSPAWSQRGHCLLAVTEEIQILCLGWQSDKVVSSSAKTGIHFPQLGFDQVQAVNSSCQVQVLKLTSSTIRNGWSSCNFPDLK